MSNCDAAWHRLLAAGKVRWMPGMLARHPLYASGMRVESLCDDWIVNGHAYVRAEAATPIWADPATLGCLLAMAREAAGCHSLYCRESSQGGWVACAREQAGERAGAWRGQTEVAALLAAIDAAPRKS